MNTSWDLTVTNRDKQPVLVTEVKTKIGASDEWAARLRRNILAHGIFPNAPYFLIVSPDHIYLWENSKLSSEELSPTYSVDARTIFQPYFERAGVAPDKISGESFQLVVSSWLTELTQKTRHELGTPQRWLIDSGLYDAIAGGSIEYEVAT